MWTYPNWLILEANDVWIYGELRGFSDPGSLHGFHIHESSDPDNNCDNNGGHYNPHALNHGGPSDVERLRY